MLASSSLKYPYQDKENTLANIYNHLENEFSLTELLAIKKYELVKKEHTSSKSQIVCEIKKKFNFMQIFAFSSPLNVHSKYLFQLAKGFVI